MDLGLILPIVVVVALLVIIAIYLWATYNSLVALRARVDEAWSDVTAQFRRRAELVPSLVEQVQGYATHEQRVLEAARSASDETVEAATPADASVAEDHLARALKAVLVTADAFPKLQASQQFLQLQSELGDTENRIQAARRFYNGGVRELNTRVTAFPNRLWASRAGFAHRDYFDVPEVQAISEPPRVQF